jgi:hypothetical protein
MIAIPSFQKSAPAQSRPVATFDTQPLFIRLPRAGKRCPVTGLSRSSLEELTVPSAANNFTAPVKSHVKKVPGAGRGIRLIDRESLVAYIRGLPPS